MSRPGDTGYTLTRYVTDEAALKHVHTFPLDDDPRPVVATAYRAATCRHDENCDSTYCHAAGECFYLDALYDLFSGSPAPAHALEHHDPAPSGS